MLIPFCGRYVFRHDINTPETREIMERAVGAKAEELDADWPEHVFTLPNNTLCSSARDSPREGSSAFTDAKCEWTPW